MPASPPPRKLVIALVAVGVFMATLDSSIVNVSLPSMARYFGVPLGPAVEWVVMAYLVVVAALLLTVGRLADLFGHKVVWAAGLVLFTAASALCGAAPSLPLLISARGLQGIGGALLMAISPAMVTSAFPPEQRGRAIGINAVVVALGVSAGPTLGGLITEQLSWRWIFFINLPLGIIGFVATLKYLPSDHRGGSGVGRHDPLGALLLAVALASLTAGLSVGNEVGWRSPTPLLLGATGLGGTIALLVHERRHPHPIIDLGLFRNRLFACASLSQVLSFVALFAVSFLLPFYFEQLRGFDTATTGLMLTPLPLTLAVIAPLSGSLADRIGARWLATLGMAFAVVGLALLARIDAASSKADIIWRLMVAGVGQGLFQTPNNSALLGAAPPHRQGVASGLLATGRIVGQSLSVAIAGAVFTSLGGAVAGRALAGAQRSAADPLQSTFLTSFHAALHLCAAVAAIGVLTSMVRGPNRAG